MAETVQGRGPLPKRKPRYRVRFPRQAAEVSSIKRARLQQAAMDVRESQPGFSDRDQELAAQTAVEPLDQGENVRSAGINVPISRSKLWVQFPFGRSKADNPRRARIR